MFSFFCNCVLKVGEGEAQFSLEISKLFIQIYSAFMLLAWYIWYSFLSVRFICLTFSEGISNNSKGNSILLVSEFLAVNLIFERKFIRGRVKSSKKSNSIWSIFLGKTSSQGPLQAPYNSCECLYGIRLSLIPCTMKVGLVTVLICSRLSNLSLTKYWIHFPARSLTTALIEVNGDIKTRPPTVFLEAKYVAGPLPIDLPNTIIFYCLNLSSFVKYSNTSSASSRILESEGLPL